MRSTLFAPALAALLAAAPAAAAPQTYFTFGAAASSFDAVAPAGCTLTATNDSAFGGALGVGYGFDPHLALEFGFINFGTLDAAASCPGPTTAVITAPDSGLELSAVFSLPFGDSCDADGFAAYARLGGFSWSENAQSGTESVVGIGLQWRYDHNTAVRFEYGAYGDVDALQLTLRWDY